MKYSTIIAATALVMSAAAAQAAPVSPVSYDMLNGGSGSYNYWDKKYNGSGSSTTNYAALSGGVGDLTDGIIAAGNWFVEEPPVGGEGPYVGWANLNPEITFNFASDITFNSVTFHFDDSDGNGGVSQPGSVTVNGSNYVVPVNPGSAPFAFTVDLMGQATNQIETQIFRTNAWVFLSEVTFDAQVAPVPLPAGGVLLLGGLAAFGAMRRKART